MSTELEIIELLKRKDERGLRLLYKNYSGTLYGIAFRILKSDSFSEDALQKSFLKIWNNIEQYDSSKSILYTWMANIVKNTSIDIRRLKSFQQEEKTITIDPHVHSDVSNSSKSNTMDVSNLLSKLDEKYAVVIDYLYLRGYSQSELSDELDLPLGTIKTRVKKAMDLLRAELKNEKSFFIGFLSLIFILLSLMSWI